jgi:cupin 2 domain-containing protein
MRVHAVRNLLTGLPAELPEELKEELAAGPGARIERIVSRGHRSPDGFWYDQPEDEWVMVLAGRGAVEVEGEQLPVELGPGDSLLLPAHARHRVAWTAEDEATVWLAVFFGRT